MNNMNEFNSSPKIGRKHQTNGVNLVGNNNASSTPDNKYALGNDDDVEDGDQHPKTLRASFLPNEVKFCDVSDDDDDDDDYEVHFGSEDDAVSVSTSSARNRRPKPSHNVDEIDADSIMSSGSKTRSKPEIPDGGYGWVVVCASLVVSLIADGISFSFGLLYTEFLSYFGESKSKTAWIGSIFLAVPLLSGPVMSNLVDKYGCQRMTIIGGVLSGIGFVCASASNTVGQLYWTFGVIGGLGLGIGYVTAVCSVVGWFDKRRTFATGIGASGTGIGTFLYAPLTQYLIESYGWRGTCLILAGTLFNICVCGCLMLDPEWLIESNKLESRSQSMKTFSNSSVCLDEIKKLLEDGAPNDMVLDTLVTSYNTEANQQLTDPNQSFGIKKYRSLLLLPTYFSPDGDIDCGIVTGNQLGSRRSLRRKFEDDVPLFDDGTRKTVGNHLMPTNNNVLISNGNTANKKRLQNSDDSINRSEKCTFYDEDEQFCSKTICNEELVPFLNNDIHHKINAENGGQDQPKPTNDVGANAAHTNDVIIQIPSCNYLTVGDQSNVRKRTEPSSKGVLRHNTNTKTSNYLRNMRLHRNSIHYRGAMLSTHRYRLRTSSCPNIYRNSMTTLAQDPESTWMDSAKDFLKSIFDFSLFLNPKFVYFEISTLLLFIWFIVPYFYLPEHMLTKGYVEDDSAFVIAVIGVSQTFGMIGLGYIGDKPWLNVPKTYAGCLVVCGISVVFMPIVAHSYVLLCIVGAIFGLMFASSFSFTPIILVQLVSLDDFTCAYGLVLLIQGVGNLVGPPISGVLYEWYGIWDYAFYTSGVFIALAGVFVYITGILQDRDLAKEEKGESAEMC